MSPDREPHSIHGYFIAPGDIHQDLLFDVETLRDGHSFSSRRVNVTQSQGSILTAIASFQTKGQQGVEYADPMPADVPEPESLKSSKELMEPFADKSSFAKYYAYNSPFDIRYVSQPILLGPDKSSHEGDSGKQLVWMRADGSCDVSQTMHRAMLALGCDQIMLEPILRRTGLTVMTPGISFASIDHSMWWYRDLDVTQWHLYVQDTPTAGHGRGLRPLRSTVRTARSWPRLCRRRWCACRIPNPATTDIHSLCSRNGADYAIPCCWRRSFILGCSGPSVGGSWHRPSLTMPMIMSNRLAAAANAHWMAIER